MTLDFLQKRHLVLTISKFIFAGISIYILYRAQKNLDYFTQGYLGIMANWNKDQISGIYANSSVPLGPDEYKLVWSGTYKGTVTGCDCPYTDNKRGVNRGLHRHSCSHNETEARCVEIEEMEPIHVTNWVNKDVTYLKLIKNSSFTRLHEHMDDQGNCKEGTKRCGNPNSISKGLCVPESWADCPLSDISIAQFNPSPSYYTESANFSQYSIYYTRSSSQNPVPDLDAGEYTMCENPQQAGLTPGRSAYVLYRPDTDNCKNDSRYFKLDSMGEQDMLEFNHFQYHYLPQFRTSNKYLWSRFFRRIIEWRPFCLSEVPQLNELSSSLQSTNTFCKIVTYISYALIAGKIITDIIELVYVLNDKAHDRTVTIVIRVRMVLNAIILPLLGVMILKSSPIKDYFGVLVKRKCSDDFTNTYFDGLYETMKKDVYMLNLMALYMGLLTLALDIYDQIITMIKVREQRLDMQIPLVERPDETRGIDALQPSIVGS